MVAERRDGAGGEARDDRVPGQRGELGERVDAVRFEFEALVAAEVGDKAEVVVVAASILAVNPPVAEVAACHGVRVARRRLRRGCFELGAALGEELVDAGRVGVEVVGGEGRIGVVAEEQPHPRRPPALEAGEVVVVEEQLEDVLGPRLAAELGVGHLVAPVAEIRRFPVDADQEVRVADPALVHEAALVDDLLPGAHRGEGLVDAPLPRRPVGPLDRQHAAPSARHRAIRCSSHRLPRSSSSSMFGGFRLPTGSSRASSTSRYVRYSQPRNRVRAEGLLGRGVGEDGLDTGRGRRGRPGSDGRVGLSTRELCGCSQRPRHMARAGALQLQRRVASGA